MRSHIPQRDRAAWLALLLLLLAASRPAVEAASLGIQILPRFGGAPLIFDALTNTTTASQRISVTRLDFLLSNIALRGADGSWVTWTNGFAYLSGRDDLTSFRLPEIPAGHYDRLRFNVGVPAMENHANPAGLPAGHPLNPNVNGLHWSWQGGYVFLALEGNWQAGSPASNGAAPASGQRLQASGTPRVDAGIPNLGGYSWHIASDRLLATVELSAALDLAVDCELRLALNVDRIFSGQHVLQISDDTSSTHSRADDNLALHLRENIETAFGVLSFAPCSREKAGVSGALEGRREALMASNATPYRFTFSRHFPQPALPLDNPLAEEGVELGRRLFHDERMSVNDRQSCASCHQADAGFVDAGKRFSPGAEGQTGTRNVMPLFNLAWKDFYFWDGRAPSLREQVLMPIQNPIEMHETLSNVVAKLSARSSRREVAHSEIRIDQSLLALAATSSNYPALFTRAFGTPEITPDRIARALEQFLLIQVSHSSKFDRVLNGQAEFTDGEKRGFELFHTEYDPRRGQFGADCFHCHGGPLFRSQGFANNGLDATFKDRGRSLVTGKPGDHGKFAVPSLRNAAATAPYMHDGRFATLEEVVEHYASGVRRSATLDPNLAKHPEGGVPLSAEDKRALVTFLQALTEDADPTSPAFRAFSSRVQPPRK